MEQVATWILLDGVRGIVLLLGPLAAGGTVGTAMLGCVEGSKVFLLGVPGRAVGRGGGKGEMEMADTEAECAR